MVPITSANLLNYLGRGVVNNKATTRGVMNIYRKQSQGFSVCFPPNNDNNPYCHPTVNAVIPDLKAAGLEVDTAVVSDLEAVQSAVTDTEVGYPEVDIAILVDSNILKQIEEECCQ